jgi:alanine dehydrogenase
MKVGVVKEIKNNENRVGLTPDCVGAFVEAGHRVLIERRAGDGSGFYDDEYTKAGAEILESPKEVWNVSDMIVKVKEPIQEEYAFLREDLVLFTYLHLAADEPLTTALLQSKTTGVAYETITDAGGALPCLVPMSVIAGRMSVAEGAKYLETTFGGRGVLIGGVPGVERGNVAILGAGTVGREACKIAVGLGAKVTILDVDPHKLSALDDLYGNKVQTLYSSPAAIRQALSGADIVIGAVLLPGKKAPKLVGRADLSLMKKGSVLVDVAVDQGGCFETTAATTHENPIYIVDGVVHYCVANMPGAVARTSTIALTNATVSLGLELANKGFKKAVIENEHLRRGVNTLQGKCTFGGVAEAFNLSLTDVTTLL